MLSMTNGVRGFAQCVPFLTFYPLFTILQLACKSNKMAKHIIEGFDIIT